MKKIMMISILLASLLSLPVHAEIVVVAPKSTNLDSLNLADIRQLFTGKKNNANGITLIPLDLPSESEERKTFYSEVLGKSASQMRAHWARMTFTGKATPPKIVSGTQELRIMLSTGTRDYIAYMDSANVSPEMKVLYRHQ